MVLAKKQVVVQCTLNGSFAMDFNWSKHAKLLENNIFCRLFVIKTKLVLLLFGLVFKVVLMSFLVSQGLWQCLVDGTMRWILDNTLTFFFFFK